jgi:hypothetical protein
LLILNTTLLLQGFILSNALRAQKSAEDEGCTMALNNLRSEVIELRNEGLEKRQNIKLIDKQDKKKTRLLQKPNLRPRNVKLKIFENSWQKKN